jgi:hypothetical protein
VVTANAEEDTTPSLLDPEDAQAQQQQAIRVDRGAASARASCNIVNIRVRVKTVKTSKLRTFRQGFAPGLDLIVRGNGRRSGRDRRR